MKQPPGRSLLSGVAHLSLLQYEDTADLPTIVICLAQGNGAKISLAFGFVFSTLCISGGNRILSVLRGAVKE